MSKKYVLTADFFEGSITYGFADNQRLDYLELNVPACTDEQHQNILKQLQHGLHEDRFIEWANHYRFTYLVIGQNVDFATFWNLYKYKRGIDVVRPEYDKLTDADKALVMKNVKEYNIYCERNASWYNKMLAVTYLKNKEWKTEWLKLKRG